MLISATWRFGFVVSSMVRPFPFFYPLGLNLYYWSKRCDYNYHERLIVGVCAVFGSANIMQPSPFYLVFLRLFAVSCAVQFKVRR